MTQGIPSLEVAHNRDEIDYSAWAHEWFDRLHSLDTKSQDYVDTIGYIANLTGRNIGLRQSDTDAVNKTMTYLRAIGAPQPYKKQPYKELTELQQSNRVTWQERRYTAMEWGEHIVAITLNMAEHEARQRELEWKATHDQLTGLHNRRGLEKGAAAIMDGIERGHHEAAAVLVLDLDQFKPVNDLLGHDKGDAVLERVGNIINKKTRRAEPGRMGDVVARVATKDEPEHIVMDDPEEWGSAEVARLGGDEFVVILPLGDNRRDHPSRWSRSDEALEQPSKDFSPTLEQRASVVAERLKTEITTALLEETEGKVPGVGVSIGIGMLHRGDDMERALRQATSDADVAMYQQKTNGRDQDSSRAVQHVQPTPRYV